jgi:hypothetical protein
MVIRKTYFKLLAPIFVILLGTALPVFAGGGRFHLQSYSSPGFIGTNGIYIQAWVTNKDQGTRSIGENAEFRIQNPRSGDRCETTNKLTNENGILFGICYASEVGQIMVYVHSNDKNDESIPYLLYFQANPTPTTAKVQPSVESLTTQPKPTEKNYNITPTINNARETPLAFNRNELSITPVSKETQTSGKSVIRLILDFCNSILLKILRRK